MNVNIILDKIQNYWDFTLQIIENALQLWVYQQ